MRGRKNTPSATLRLQGTYRPDRHGDAVQVPAGKPTCPRHLDRIAKTEWRRLAKLLHTAGILTEADRAVLCGYCEAWSTYVKASQEVQKYGHVLLSPKTKMPFASPHLNIMSMALKHMGRFAAELGLSPSSRSRVNKVTAPTTNDKSRFFRA